MYCNSFDIELDIARKLMRDNNFKKRAFLAQFNPYFREKLSVALRNIEDAVDPSCTKLIKAECLSCGEQFFSGGILEDYGECFDCYTKFSRKMAKLTPEKPTSLSQKKCKKSFPRHLGEDKIKEIADLIYQKYYVTHEVDKKKKLIAIIFRELGIRLKYEEFMSIAATQVLKKRGYKL